VNGHLLIVAALYAARWLASRLWWPFRPCPRCQGRGTNRASNKKRHGTCRRCGGTRHVQRLGSRTVHRAIRSAVAYRRDRKDGKP
jgi:hypothetical protein